MTQSLPGITHTLSYLGHSSQQHHQHRQRHCCRPDYPDNFLPSLLLTLLLSCHDVTRDSARSAAITRPIALHDLSRLVSVSFPQNTSLDLCPLPSHIGWFQATTTNYPLASHHPTVRTALSAGAARLSSNSLIRACRCRAASRTTTFFL